MKTIKASIFSSYNSNNKLEGLELEEVTPYKLYRLKVDTNLLKEIRKFRFCYKKQNLLLEEHVSKNISCTEGKTIFDFFKGNDNYFYLNQE